VQNTIPMTSSVVRVVGSKAKSSVDG
jgi:hypothetical protein